MTLPRYGRLAAVAVTGALALTACGSDSNVGSSGTSAPAGAGSAAPSASASGGAGSGSCGTGSLNAEGSTAQKNAMDAWISAYQQKCSGAKITYNGTGSGKGILGFTGKQDDFAGSDSALDAAKGEPAAAKARCDGNDAWDLPMAVGPIAVAYNVKGLDGVVLNGEVTAKIFTGAIKTWNDPAIKALNSGATLPSEPIKVFFRSDESGTTQNFEKYLAAAGNGTFKAEPAKKWGGPVGQGKSGSAGVQQAVSSTPGGIGYMEYSFAKTANLGVAKIDNGSGPVELSADSAGKAIAAAKQKGTGNDLALSIDYATKAAGAYPIVLVTYEVVCSKGGVAADKTALLKAFLTYTSSAEGQQAVSGDLGYGTLPADLQTKVTAAVAALS